MKRFKFAYFPSGCNFFFQWQKQREYKYTKIINYSSVKSQEHTYNWELVNKIKGELLLAFSVMYQLRLVHVF